MLNKKIFIPVANPTDGIEEANLVHKQIKSGWFSMGKKVKEFERQKNIKKYNDIKTAVLEKMTSVAEFDAVSKILDNINDEDIQDPKKMKAKLSSYISSVKKYAKTKVK